MTTTRTPSSVLTSLVVSSRYMPVYIAIALLVAVAAIWAPAALSATSLRGLAALGSFLAIASLGQMLVIMTGGIDLSVPGILGYAGYLVMGVGMESDARLWTAILTALGVSALLGLVNGILIGGFKLNALIVTLAVGQISIGMMNRYYTTKAIRYAVPPGLDDWAHRQVLGVSAIFWFGAVLTAVFILVFRYTTVGRRFKAVGANPTAANVAGLRVTVNQVAAYTLAGLLYGLAGVLLAGFLVTPGVGFGARYLLGPIAAVVIGGASLTGGLASPLSTWSAAFFLAGLDQTMRVMGLDTAWQFVVFGLVIIGGMLVSGDRIIKGVERLLRERRRPGRAAT